jgi:hypothetical protein
VSENWVGYEWLWTTKEYALHRFSYEGVEHEVIIHLPTTKLLTIENNEAYHAVKRKMREEGVEIIDDVYLRKLRGR